MEILNAQHGRITIKGFSDESICLSTDSKDYFYILSSELSGIIESLIKVRDRYRPKPQVMELPSMVGHNDEPGEMFDGAILIEPGASIRIDNMKFNNVKIIGATETFKS
jgi:hypothetical protein